MRRSWLILTLAVAAGAAGLAGCEQQSSKPARAENAASATASGSDASATAPESRFDERGERRGRRDRAANDGPARQDGTPMWAGSRRGSGQENAQEMFEKNGKDFGAKSVDDYVDRAHAFASNPPAGVKTATRRNGDKLFYDPASNTFVVVNRRGAPRIMMKPRNGEKYWERQLARINEDGAGGDRQARRERRREQGSGGGEDAG
jgi:pyocin large subunit-like protein